MSTTPGLIGRQLNRVEFMFRDSPDVQAWRVRAANSLTQAVAATQILFTVQRSVGYRSPSLVSKRIRFPDGSIRGLTQVMYDPADFEDPANNVPGDDALSFIRVQEQNAAGVWRSEGPIYVLPTAAFFSVEKPTLTLNGTAPAAVLGATEVPPAAAMHIVFPRPVSWLNVRNLGATSILRVGVEAGQPMSPVPVSTVDEPIGSNSKDLFLCVDHASNTTTFSCRVMLLNGPQ